MVPNKPTKPTPESMALLSKGKVGVKPNLLTILCVSS